MTRRRILSERSNFHPFDLKSRINGCIYDIYTCNFCEKFIFNFFINTLLEQCFHIYINLFIELFKSRYISLYQWNLLHNDAGIFCVCVTQQPNQSELCTSVDLLHPFFDCYTNPIWCLNRFCEIGFSNRINLVRLLSSMKVGNEAELRWGKSEHYYHGNYVIADNARGVERNRKNKREKIKEWEEHNNITLECICLRFGKSQGMIRLPTTQVPHVVALCRWRFSYFVRHVDEASDEFQRGRHIGAF